MTDWKKTLREALKDTEGAYDTAIKALDSAGIKLQDVGTGDYVSSQKYNDEVTKLQNEIDSLKNAPNPLAKELEQLKETHTSEMAAEKAKVASVIKAHAISEKLGSLGITNELELVGLKSLIKTDDIKLDDDYNIVGDSLDKQIDELKKTYGSSFEAPKVVSTGQSLQTSQTAGKTLRQYGSLAEIQGLSQEEVNADLANIMSQLGNLK